MDFEKLKVKYYLLFSKVKNSLRMCKMKLLQLIKLTLFLTLKTKQLSMK